ncbi:MAG: hypothetical protein LBK82_17265 [Planctomycetaceae bacterium]|jgi:hypothetical protein|nr:hypothetical protein [Planctomycetaceae bacterium]
MTAQPAQPPSGRIAYLYLAAFRTEEFFTTEHTEKRKRNGKFAIERDTA